MTNRHITLTENMEQHNALHSTQSRDQIDDEISLGELASMLWQGKRLILAVMAAAVCIASAYVFFTPNIYEARSETLPPPESSVTAYDGAWRLVTGLPTTTTTTTTTTTAAERAYNTFKQYLTSESLRQHFFESEYFPANMADHSRVNQADQPALKEKLWQQLQKELTITEDAGGKGGKIKTNHIILTLQGRNPQQITDWVNQYIQSAITLTQQEWLSNLNSERQQRIQYLNEKIAAQRAVAQVQKNNRMAQLKEAVALAQANELQTTSNAGNFVTPYQDDFLYLRGSRVLKAELAEMENRSNNDPFIPELPHLLEHKQLLESIELSANQIGVAQVDFPAVTPVLPIKPKKALILALSVVLGGMLGGMIVIGRGFYGKQK